MADSDIVSADASRHGLWMDSVSILDTAFVDRRGTSPQTWMREVANQSCLHMSGYILEEF